MQKYEVVLSELETAYRIGNRALDIQADDPGEVLLYPLTDLAG